MNVPNHTDELPVLFARLVQWRREFNADREWLLQGEDFERSGGGSWPVRDHRRISKPTNPSKNRNRVLRSMPYGRGLGILRFGAAKQRLVACVDRYG
jgi:hypothetical protein